MERSYALSVATILIMALLAPALSGCSNSKTVPVNGQVKFKDGSDISVLARYTVSLESEAEKVSGAGEVAADGKFKITTYTLDDGAIPGRHRVAITPPDPLPDGPPPKMHVPQRYRSFETSGLTIDVKPGQKNVELELERVP
jgi:hypothetical protein